MLLFLELLALLVIALLIIYAIGAGIIRLFQLPRQEPYFRLFLALVIGVSVLVIIYALLCTGGSSVLFAVLLMLGFILMSLRTTSLAEVTTQGLFGNGLPVLLGTGFLVFLGQYLLLYDHSSPYLQTPFQDYVYYSRLTLPLNKWGIETNQLEAVYPQFLTEQPYHYFELWLNAILVKATSLPSVWVFFVSTAAILTTIISVGFMSVFAHFKLPRVWVVLLGILFLTITGTRWAFLQKSMFLANGALLSSLPLALNPKLTPIYIFVILTTVLLLRRQYMAAGVAMAIIPLVFVSTTPVICIGGSLLTVYLLSKREISIRKAALIVVSLAFSSVFIAAFYLLQPEPYQFPSTGRAFALRSIIPDNVTIRTLVNITVGVFVNYFIYFLGYIILIAGLLIQRKKIISLVRTQPVVFVWFVVTLVLSAAMRAFGTHFLDSFQFFSNIMVPLTPAVLAVALGVALKENAQWKHLALTVVGLGILLSVNLAEIVTDNTRYSPDFLQQVEQVSAELGNRGGYIMDDKNYKNAYMLSPDSYTTGNYVSNFKNDYAFVSLSCLDVDSLTSDPRFQRDSAQAVQIVRKASFYRFAKFQALQGKHMPLDSLKYRFVLQAGLRFVCTSREAQLPSTIQPLVRTTYTDSYSGESLHILRQDIPAATP